MSSDDIVRFLHEQIKELSKKMDDVAKVANDTQCKVVSLETSMSQRRECPHPDMCIRLKEDVAELEDTVAELKTRSDELSGGYKALMAACIVGPIVTAALVWVIVATNAKERSAALAGTPPAAALVVK